MLKTAVFPVDCSLLNVGCWETAVAQTALQEMVPDIGESGTARRQPQPKVVFREMKTFPEQSDTLRIIFSWAFTNPP